MEHLIKRYENRKFYHMGRSQYVTLTDLAAIVLDHSTSTSNFQVVTTNGEDVTRETLVKILATVAETNDEDFHADLIIDTLQLWVG